MANAIDIKNYVEGLPDQQLQEKLVSRSVKCRGNRNQNIARLIRILTDEAARRAATTENIVLAVAPGVETSQNSVRETTVQTTI